MNEFSCVLESIVRSRLHLNRVEIEHILLYVENHDNVISYLQNNSSM